MRQLGVIGLVASVALVPRLAAAGRHGGDTNVRDHRSSSDSTSVRDHRSSDSGNSEPIVRDHRGDSAPVVRDHRGESDSNVRDHRGSDGGDGGDGGVYNGSEEPVVLSDSGSPNPFANYSGPTWILELGGVARRFQGPSFARSGSVETTSGDVASYGLASGRPAVSDTAGGAFAMRFLVPANEHLYAGAELEIGGLTRSPVRLMTDSPDIHIASRSMIGSAAVIGARARHGIAEIGGELAGGMRVLSVTVQSFDAMEEDPSTTENTLTGIVEARLRGALWVAPHVYLAAQAGANVFDRSDVNFGLSIGLSARPYGATR